MNRRDSLTALLALGSTASSIPTLAQQSNKPFRIGFLGARSRSTTEQPDPPYDAWLSGMRDLGYVEGKNLQIEWRFADSKFERLPALAEELVSFNPEVIVTHALPPTLALQKATKTIPIVFMALTDPVGTRVVERLSHPGGNLTGTSLMSLDISGKRVEILKEAVPSLKCIGFLFNPLTPIHRGMLKAAESAGQVLGLTVLAVEATNTDQIELGFQRLASERPVGLLIPDDGFYTGQHKKFIELQYKHRIPILVPYRESVDAGALICYGTSVQDSYRLGAKFVDKILRGTKPADLPVEQTTKFDYVVNLKAARALGIRIPKEVLLRADRVIE